MPRAKEGSIGYVGYEFAHRLGLHMASLEDRDGDFVQPGDEAAVATLATAQLPPYPNRTTGDGRTL